MDNAHSLRAARSALKIRPLHSLFVAEVEDIDLREVHDVETLELLQDAMASYAVLVFRNQPFDDASQLAFAQRFDGKLHSRTSVSVVAKNKFGNEAITDGSNIGSDGNILPADSRARMIAVSNRLWHTDASFQDPAGRFSMLSARLVPPVNADTEYADMRAAYDALTDDEKAQVNALRVHHTAVHSRQMLGFAFAPDELAKLPGAIHPLVRTIPRSNRQALYLAAHASSVEGMPVPEGRLLINDLMAHATQRQFVYRHEWRLYDFVIWDNRCTMHRARPFEDKKHKRDVRRTTTLDLPFKVGSVVDASDANDADFI
ncbi:TauD/TfdA family dioxygenase (plasmid) [Cupriavidus sp. KK10]|jgi:alpha-ketoglutarate-dependent 2,4-dichlorophenoxyacetate dioxygenase|uniref:TauD/TfdA dioxygenase family protein n=1 Tax=Cupriavidus sp. KK10 TaxID=1478019 RepID=UPI001BA92CF3|nr:TauD/TfdA family dioxygenase [Cupriavidus sp. KK10]QUN32531.1 TauD/TfdA family dioxygenase [Cupriavidus sp. KK10]